MFRVSLFGEFRLEDERGKPVKISSRNGQLLLAYLLLRPRHPHPRERLIDLFWPDMPPTKAKQSLRQVVYALRNAIESAERSKQDHLISTPQTIQLSNTIPASVDALEFEKELKESATCSDVDRESRLQRAVGLYTGDLLTGCYDDWCLEDREYFRARYLTALNELIQTLASKKHYDKAIAFARLSLKQDPYQEPVHYQLICLYSATGERASAIQQYQECKRILKEELGVTPLPETQALFHVLEARSAAPSTKELANSADRMAHAVFKLGSPFVDREEEFRALSQALHHAQSGAGSSFWVSGEAGVGKSRLIQEFLSGVSAIEVQVLKSRCYDLEGRLPYQPIIEAIRSSLSSISQEQLSKIPERALHEVVKLIPELEELVPNLQPSAPLASYDQERSRLFEGLNLLLTSLAKEKPLLLFIDDLQWADESSLGFVHFFARHLPSEKIMLIGSYREEEVNESHALWSIIQHLLRDHLASALSLRPFDETRVQSLVHGLLNTTSLGDFGRQIYEDSKGVPFFVEELVKSSLEDGRISVDKQGDWRFEEAHPEIESVPVAVKALVGTRLRRISAAGRQILDLAAVTGRPFTPELLSQIVGERQSEAIRSIEELIERRFLESEHEQYAFRHDMIRQVVYSEILPARRRFLHSQIGEALEMLSETSAARDSRLLGDLALHFYQAQKWKKALEYELAAGKQAWQRHYAKEEALRFFERAKELSEKLDDQLALMLAYKGLGEVCTHTDEQEVGLEYCQHALDLCDEAELRAEIYGYIARVYHNRRELDKGLEFCEKGLAELGSRHKGLITARLSFQAATFLNWLRRFDDSIEYCSSALKILERHHERALLNRTLSVLGQAYSGKGNHEKALEYLSEAANQAEKLNDPLSLGIAFFLIGIAHEEIGNAVDAVEAWNLSLHQMEQLQGQHDDISSIYNRLVYGYLRIGNLAEALKAARNQLETAKLTGKEKIISLSHGMLAALLEADGKAVEAKEHFDQAHRNHAGNDLLYWSLIRTYLFLNLPTLALEWFKRGHTFLKDRDFEQLESGQAYTPAFLAFRKHPIFVSHLSSRKRQPTPASKMKSE